MRLLLVLLCVGVVGLFFEIKQSQAGAIGVHEIEGSEIIADGEEQFLSRRKRQEDVDPDVEAKVLNVVIECAKDKLKAIKEEQVVDPGTDGNPQGRAGVPAPGAPALPALPAVPGLPALPALIAVPAVPALPDLVGLVSGRDAGETHHQGGHIRGRGQDQQQVFVKTVNNGALNIEELSLLDYLLSGLAAQSQISDKESVIKNQGEIYGRAGDTGTVSNSGQAGLVNLELLNNPLQGTNIAVKSSHDEEIKHEEELHHGEVPHIVRATDEEKKRIEFFKKFVDTDEHKKQKEEFDKRFVKKEMKSRSYDDGETYMNPYPYQAYSYAAPSPNYAAPQSYPMTYVPGYNYPASTGYYDNYYNPSTNSMGNGYVLNNGQQIYG